MTSEQRRAIYVAGFPKNADETSVLTYFSTFGRIASLEKINSPSAKHFIKLVAKDDRTFNAIVGSSQPYRFMDRELIVKPFIKGTGLIKHNLELNKRRVIAKNVPIWVDPHELKRWLTFVAGPVSNLYYYLSDLPLLHKRTRRSYSILFEKKDSASLLLSLQQVYFSESGEPTIFEKFKKAKNARKPILKSNLMVQDIQDSHHHSNLEHQIFEGKNISQHLLKKTDEWDYHLLKPTSRKYYFFRSKQPKESSHSIENLAIRINKNPPQQVARAR